MHEKILVSSCLLGEKVRYNGGTKTLANPYLDHLQKQGRVIKVCPELSVGMTIPRAPCEITGGLDGQAVLAGKARVVNVLGQDMTNLFIQAAFNSLKIAQDNRCRYALLTENSPSCATHWVYDGSFSGKKSVGMGITAALLQQHHIQIFSENELDQLYQLIG